MDNQGIQGLNNVIVWIESEFPECYQQMWKKCILQTEWKSVLTTLMIHLLKDKTLFSRHKPSINILILMYLLI